MKTNKSYDLTIQEIIKEVRKPGRVFTSSLIGENVWRVQVVKADFLWHLQQADSMTLSCFRDEEGDLFVN